MMQYLHLSDIGWILVCLVIYLLATSALPGMLFRQVQAWSGRGSRTVEHRRRPRRRVRLMSRSNLRTVARTVPEPEPQRSSEVPLLNGQEPPAIGSTNPLELALNAEEVIAVARMIEHNRTAAKPSKTSTIQAGFGVSRGGSPAYTRAALIYDALFGAPAPAVKYRELTPEHKAQLMKQKGALN